MVSSLRRRDLEDEDYDRSNIKFPGPSPTVYTCKSKNSKTTAESAYAVVTGVEQALRNGKGDLQLINLV